MTYSASCYQLCSSKAKENGRTRTCIFFTVWPIPCGVSTVVEFGRGWERLEEERSGRHVT